MTTCSHAPTTHHVETTCSDSPELEMVRTPYHRATTTCNKQRRDHTRCNVLVHTTYSSPHHATVWGDNTSIPSPTLRRCTVQPRMRRTVPDSQHLLSLFL
ncbi:hypothetical protein PAXRUDRAFT_825777 [Paxillus rubicundulus Ve08.2h10]|uniref:Unplaced genomic scaffold scaffold_156, whole genome shotgun sequence n=1 Tax=Paxillus rubicundulus Ve08.2h10 TaxID=930991 RepID=A0A0D0E070_9AGAM|nr:hypothetical protein PAXRUDRAFT_825777 [Paxillus rubicundulus Ve08.2h10]